jgi:plasmid maintenance system antidote protein VapI/integrase
MGTKHKRFAKSFPPGDVIRKKLEKRDWSQPELAAKLGCSMTRLSEILTGKVGISFLMARKFEAVLGKSAKYWMELSPPKRVSRFEKDELAAARPGPRKGTANGTSSRPLSMRQFSAAILADYVSRGSGYRTVINVRHGLALLEEDLGLRTVAGLERPSILRRFKALCATKNWMHSTEMCFLARIAGIARLGLKLGLLRTIPDFPTDPMRSFVGKSKRTLPPPESDVKTLMRYLQRNNRTWEGGRLEALVAVVALTGNNLTSTLKIRVQDIDIHEGTIRVQVPQGRYITVRISDELSAILSAWLPRVDCEWAFPGLAKMGPWTINSGFSGPNRVLIRAAHNAGVGRITYEQLRRFHKEKSTRSFELRLQAEAAREYGECFVTLEEQGRRALIRGKDVGTLSRSRFELVKLLRDAGPKGLGATDIEHKSSDGGWWKTLDRLRKSDPKWLEAIVFPGGPYGGNYRLAWEPS